VKKLYLTRKQARTLSADLQEYAGMADSSQRYLFKGFQLCFGDKFAEEMQPGSALAVTPLPEFMEVEADS
jgi:hypothetical protein